MIDLYQASARLCRDATGVIQSQPKSRTKSKALFVFAKRKQLTRPVILKVTHAIKTRSWHNIHAYNLHMNIAMRNFIVSLVLRNIIIAAGVALAAFPCNDILD